MKKIVLFALLFCWAGISAQNKTEINIDFSSPTEYSPYIFGHNLEHTRSALNTGLSAQILQNRKFAGKPSKNLGVASKWFGIGERTFFTTNIGPCYTRHICLQNMYRMNELNCQMVANTMEGATVGIGQHGIALTTGKQYSLRTVTKINTPQVLTVQLTNSDGSKVYASHQIKLDTTDIWHIENFNLTSNTDDKDADIRYTFTGRGEVYFGALSMMPSDNFHGMRKDVVENLKAIGPTVLRWPGGNFAGEYRWKDGLLPSDQRGPLQAATEIETQPHSDGYDFHEISTDDFIALCREVGAEPFITINLAWNDPKESAEWIEYCNGTPDSPYGKIRAQRGYTEPFNVKFWSLGNEMGYGHMEGPMSPEAYAALAEKHADAMLSVDPKLKLFSSGPYPNDNWAKGSAAKLAEKVEFISLHQYCGPASGYHYTTDEDIKRTYCETAASDKQCYDQALKQRACLDATGKNLHISFDEWNQWYAWYRPSSVSEGIFTAKVLHMFLQESNALDIPFCCYFQPIGEGAIIIEPEKSFLTANGQVFSVMKEHKGGLLCNTDNRSAVATVKDNVLTLTLINDSFDTPQSTTIPLKGKLISALQYTSDNVLPYSRFDESELQVEYRHGKFTATIQPHSIAILKFNIK